MTIDEFKLELSKLNIEINEDKLNKLNKYYELLIEWNQKFNLTSITEKGEVYLKHFYDSATINKIINLNNIETLCDIGTGAGFPGIVLKILFPKLKITLVDSLNKRIVFLQEVIKKLELKEIDAIHARAEDFARNNIEQFDVVTARAVAALNILLEYSIPMVKVGKYFIAMKSNISREIFDSRTALDILACKIKDIKEFTLPKENSKRSLICIEKTNKTNNKYPRKYSEIKKNTL